MNSVKGSNAENGDMINIENLDPNKIKIDEKPNKDIPTYINGYVTVKDLSYPAINSVKFLYLIINKINEWKKKKNGNKCLTLVSTDKSKYTLKRMKNYGTKSDILVDQ